MSAVSPGAFSTTWERYLPIPSCVIPRETVTPVFGTSANLIVSFGCAHIASARSSPALPLTTSDEARGDDDDALGSGAEADVAAQAERLGLRPCVRHKEGAGHRRDRDDDRRVVPRAGEDERDRGEHGSLADAVRGRVEEGAERRAQ